jgi:hypothetical protein
MVVRSIIKAISYFGELAKSWSTKEYDYNKNIGTISTNFTSEQRLSSL